MRLHVKCCHDPHSAPDSSFGADCCRAVCMLLSSGIQGALPDPVPVGLLCTGQRRLQCVVAAARALLGLLNVKVSAGVLQGAFLPLQAHHCAAAGPGWHQGAHTLLCHAVRRGYCCHSSPIQAEVMLAFDSVVTGYCMHANPHISRPHRDALDAGSCALLRRMSWQCLGDALVHPSVYLDSSLLYGIDELHRRTCGSVVPHCGCLVPLEAS